MKVFLLFVLMIIAVFSVASETKKIEQKKVEPAVVETTKTNTVMPLNDAEKLSVSRAQIALQKAMLSVVEARDALDKAKEDLNVATDAAQKANVVFQKSLDAIYSVRKITDKEYTICEGKGTLCANAPDNDLSLQPLPAQKDSPKPATTDVQKDAPKK